MLAYLIWSGVEIKLGRKSRYKRIRKAILRTFIFLVIVFVTIISCYKSYNYVIERGKQANTVRKINVDPAKGIYVEIPKGASTEKIAQILKDKGIIKYPNLFKILSMVYGYDGLYQWGTHLVSNDLSYEEIMHVLMNKPITIKVTIPEGSNIKQVADILLKNKIISSVDKFFEVMNKESFNFKFLEGLPQREHRLEGYLFPDTYEFYINAGEKEVINTLLKNFDAKFKPEYYEKAKAMNMTVDQIIILASIIEREAKLAEEREIIASVFYNRLASKDQALRKLQSCATIQYIYYMKEGIMKEQITEADTQVESPYNTYQIEGLPPGPICCPGEDSIKAALFPEKTNYYYFVSRGDGTHEFSETLKQHQAAMKKYGIN